MRSGGLWCALNDALRSGALQEGGQGFRSSCQRNDARRVGAKRRQHLWEGGCRGQRTWVGHRRQQQHNATVTCD